MTAGMTTHEVRYLPHGRDRAGMIRHMGLCSCGKLMTSRALPALIRRVRKHEETGR